MSVLSSSQFIIIGAGFAGAATAYHLTRLGARDIVILEQEKIAGVHSSGRNASMIRQVVPESSIMVLAKEGADFLRNLPSDWPVPVEFRQNGSLLLGSGEGWQKLLRDAEMARNLGIEAESWPPERTKNFVPVLRETRFDGAIWCPTDGVVDIHALLSGYLKAAVSLGAKIRYGCVVRGIELAAGRVSGVVTAEEIIKAECVINAAGPWAAELGKMAGAEVPLRPCRRHLFVTAPLSWVDPAWPFVWHDAHGVYFRPDSGGLLLCPCDQDEMGPCDPPTDNAIAELLAEKIRRSFPGIADVAIRKNWAGLRTLTPDGRFVIGWDSKVQGFFWVAGLGGHGVTTSSSIGRLAADLVLKTESARGCEFSPARFASLSQNGRIEPPSSGL
ncbi:MAG: FAD-binding oxidoreductase [Deltaproteobacteria bacterium]|nr:FAD-binding oxidoreductase [Deltaproteobacteria bacterium]